MSKTRILVVEDDAAIRRGVTDALAFEGFEALQAADGAEGMEKALNYEYDLLLLDLVLPRHDGLEILEKVRENRANVPVIILTAKGDETDRVRGLKLGADDYVVKPFSIKELLARVEAVLRRSPERSAPVAEIAVPGGMADVGERVVRFEDGDSCDLSEREAGLLRYLASNAGRTISRDEILTRVWRINARGVETRTIDMHIARLRDKLRDNSSDPRVIRTVRGKGYVFVPQGETG